MIDPEKIKQAIAEAEKLAEIEGQLNDAQKNRLVIQNSLLEQIREKGKLANKTIAMHQRTLDAEKGQTEQSEKRIEASRREIERAKTLGQIYRDNSKDIDAAIAKSGELAAKTRASIYESIGAEKERKKVALSGIRDIKDLTSRALGAVEVGAESIGATMASVLKSPELALLATFSDVGTGVEGIVTKVDGMLSKLETGITGIAQKQGIAVKELGDTFSVALDPQRFINLGGAFEKGFEPMDQIGLDGEQLNQTISSLISNTDVFTTGFMKNNKASAAFVSNTIAGLNKIGVPIANSSKLLQTFVKTLGKAPKEATKEITKVVSIAKSLGLSTAKVAQNFNSSTAVLSQFGDRMGEVFADLQAQSKATGVAFADLQGFAMGFDTFEGAATKAQSLNAVLGGTFLSVTDLVNADPADKISMIQDAIANAGIDFETADRRMKMVIANAAGFKSVEEASRVLLNKEEAVEAADALETKVMTQEELEGKIVSSMTTAQKMTKGLQTLNGGMKEFLDTVGPGALKFGNVMTNTYDNLLSKTENSLGAMMAFRGVMESISVMQTGAITKAKDMAMALPGITPDVVNKLGAGALGTFSLTQLIQGGGTELGIPGFEEVSEIGKMRKKQREGGAPVETPMSNLLQRIDNNTTSIKELATALKDSSDRTIELQVDAILDGQKVGEGTKEATLELLNDKKEEIMTRGK